MKDQPDPVISLKLEATGGAPRGFGVVARNTDEPNVWILMGRLSDVVTLVASYCVRASNDDLECLRDSLTGTLIVDI